MKKPDYTILVCNSYRVAGDAQGYCNKQGATSLVQCLAEGCSDRGLDAVVTTTACFSVCSQGPIVVIQPNNYWYGGVNEDRVEEILDALEAGNAVEEYLIA
ncbi:MAG: (2Fe-2S) ferredoxin domain-containing protein [Bacteroidales bacterium]|jgi:(2Fe-2S) ferredoxin|nr:(2Fe-2S) ferredoxin domain-containing protein [Bacteroidales bacterium]